MLRRRRPSLLGGLLWTGTGVLLLFHTLGTGSPGFWTLAARYWPVLLILLGLGKILDYFLNRNVSIGVGEILGILLVALIGSLMAGVSETRVIRVLRDMPVRIGGISMRPGEWLGDSHTYFEESTFPIGSSTPVRIENSYGRVSVSPGNNGEIRVRLRKVIYGNEELAGNLAGRLRLEGGIENGERPPSRVAEGGAADTHDPSPFVLRTNREALDARNYTFNTDMQVFVPRKSRVQVINSFGAISVEQIDGKLNLSTTDKSIDVRDCKGEFAIAARYAECRLVHLAGNVRIDGRGRIYVKNIKGDLEIANQYSPVEISDVDGKVSVSMVEGSLRAENVSRSTVVNGRGTRMKLADLGGSLEIIGSHRDIEISNVDSDVSAESSYAALKLTGIRGDVDINSNSDRIVAADVDGDFKLQAHGTQVTARDIRGAVDIETTLKEVVVNGFSNSCRVTNEYAGISVSSGNLVKGDVNLRNSRGTIDLYLPGNASFVIDAGARNGSVECNYPGLEPVRNGNAMILKSEVNSGDSKINLQTDYGNIHIYRAPDRRNAARQSGRGFQEGVMP